MCFFGQHWVRIPQISNKYDHISIFFVKINFKKPKTSIFSLLIYLIIRIWIMKLDAVLYAYLINLDKK